jgi:hypothetical protein
MNPNDQSRWKNQILEFALAAFAAHEPLRAALIFKGARILNLRLGDTAARESFDLDTNLDILFTKSHPRRDDRREFFNRECERALKRFFGQQEPIRYEVKAVRTEPRPPKDNHPFDWGGFRIEISVSDKERSKVRGLQAIVIEIASYEEVGEHAVSDLMLRNGLIVRAQTLERIAGEKMRAFLTSLPTYIAKIGCHQVRVRTKDLYDLARIRRRFEIADNAFWRTAGSEFHLACESRFVDCAGIETFAEDLSLTRQIYERDPNLPKDIHFDEAWAAVQAAVSLFTGLGILPFAFPIPEGHFQSR